MCTGLEPLLLGMGASAGVASVGATAIGALGAGLAAKSLMKQPQAPAAAAQPEPAKERATAEAQAAQTANAKISMTRRAMRANSLLTGAGETGTLGKAAAAPAAGRTTLGV
jgi:hypothetical protein